MILRIVLLVLYFVGLGVLHVYLRERPPRFKGQFVDPVMRPLWALVWMWGPLLAFVPGLLWIGLLPIPFYAVLVLSICVPLSLFLIFLLFAGAFPASADSSLHPMGAYVLVSIPLFVILFTLLTLTPDVRLLLQLMLFMAFTALPTLVGILFFLMFVPNLVPLPSDQKQRFRHIVAMVVGFFTTFPKPTWVVEDGEVETRIAGNNFFGVGPGWLMTEPHNVVVVKGGTDIRRIVGPGTILMDSAEAPFQVVDLRNQIRITRINAVTKDGIEVRVPIASLFRVRRGRRERITPDMLEQGLPWPYRHLRDIYQIVFAEEVDPAGKTPLEAHQATLWDDIPLNIATGRLRQVISEYTLDELYSIDPDSGDLMRAKIGKTVRQTVIDNLENRGYEIIGGGVGNVITPIHEAVINKRVEAWKARWVNQILEWQTEVEARRFQDLTRIHQQARLDFITQLIESTHQRLQDSNYYPTAVIAYHMIENLLHIAQKPKVKSLLPESAIPALAQLQQLTQEES